MLDPEEAVAIAERFGVTLEQVRRDHLISHLLAALAVGAGDQAVFFGGTALARTHLPNGRLSEDIDLLAVGDRSSAAAVIEATLAAGARRAYGRLAWEPALRETHGSESAVIRTVDGMTVRVQLLGSTGYPPWPTEVRGLHQRYGDAPPARLRVFTRAAFAASKTAAWYDRGAPVTSTTSGRWLVEARWMPRPWTCGCGSAKLVARRPRTCLPRHRSRRLGGRSLAGRRGSPSLPRKPSTSFVPDGPPQLLTPAEGDARAGGPHTTGQPPTFLA